MVTSSYVSPEMSSLHQSATNEGVCLINECGLDPGIDHMLSMRCIDETREANGKVRGGSGGEYMYTVGTYTC